MKNKGPDISEAVLCGEYEAVYRYVLTFCPEADAQDVTQETFLKAMSANAGFAGQSSLYTWLCAIARNIWRNRCKKLGRETPLEDAPPEESADVERTVEERDGYLALHRAIHALTEPYREVFSLRAMGELSFAEIASLFGKTESWARVTYHRARSKVREMLRKEGML